MARTARADHAARFPRHPWQARISADTALRLGRFFGTTDRFWLSLQTRFDLEVEKDRLRTRLDEIQPLPSA